MSIRSQKAKDLFLEGYNCAQAVFCAFNDVTCLDFVTASKLSSSFGGGLGRLREVCGAVSGMCMVAGILYGPAYPDDRQAKADHYARIQELARRFREENGSIICRVLLGEKTAQDISSDPVPEIRSAQYYKKRPCAELVESAARIMDEYIKENPV
ncbi:MAG: C_GCAxxG_C_C family protein [Clostridia bacterium]|nr:C_GCAxxG_C_C family protein [Clostridia bacterium]